MRHMTATAIVTRRRIEESIGHIRRYRQTCTMQVPFQLFKVCYGDLICSHYALCVVSTPFSVLWSVIAPTWQEAIDRMTRKLLNACSFIVNVVRASHLRIAKLVIYCVQDSMATHVTRISTAHPSYPIVCVMEYAFAKTVTTNTTWRASDVSSLKFGCMCTVRRTLYSRMCSQWLSF